MTTTDRSGPEPISDPEYACQLGARLRAIREQRGWSLRDVQVVSRGRFKGSAVGTYERGERGISVQRLSELAQLYRVPVERFLPESPARQTRREPWCSDSDPPIAEKIVIDLVAMEERTGPHFDALRHYIDTIKLQRGDFNGRVLSVRSTDVWAMAAMATVDPATLVRTLDRFKVLHSAGVSEMTKDVNLTAG